MKTRFPHLRLTIVTYIQFATRENQVGPNSTHNLFSKRG